MKEGKKVRMEGRDGSEDGIEERKCRKEVKVGKTRKKEVKERSEASEGS